MATHQSPTMNRLIMVVMVVVAFTMVTVIFSVYNLQVRSAQNSSPENKNFLIYHNQTSSRNTFYEFCDQEFVHRIDLLAYNVTWYILAVDDKFYPNELSILTTVEDMDMKMEEGRVQFFPHSHQKIVVELWDSVTQSYVGCSTTLEIENVNIRCPLPRLTKEVEKVYIRIQNGIGIHEHKRLDLCRVYEPEEKHNVTACVAFVHNIPDLELRYLEFIEYHREIGITNFMFYDRTTTYKSFLRNHYPPNLVTHVHWPGLGQDLNIVRSKYAGYYDQMVALNHCLYSVRRKTKWAGLYDLDEWALIPDGRKVIEVLDEQDKLVPNLAIIIMERLDFKLGIAYNSSMMVMEQFTQCDLTHGQQKFFVKPDNTYGASIHFGEANPPFQRIKLPSDNINFSTPRFNHYMDMYVPRTQRLEGHNEQILIYKERVRSRINTVITSSNLYSGESP